MPAVSYVGAGTAQDRSGTSGTSSILGVPAGVIAGDLLIAALAGTSTTLTAPTGWTLLLTQVDNGNNGRLTVFYRVATAGEPATYAFATPSNTGRAGVMVAYRGAAVPTVVAGGFTNNNAPNTTAPQVTTAQQNNFVLSAFSCYVGYNNTYFGTPGADFNVRYNAPSVANPSAALEVVDRLQAAAGASTQPTVYNYAQVPAAQHASIVIPIYNATPAAPVLGSPGSGTSINRAQANTFTWAFSDTDVGDQQSAFDLQYRPVGASTWTTVSQTTSSQSWVAPASTFTNDTQYEWQVRTADTLGAVGPYSSSQQFLAATPQPAPTITVPASGATITQPNTTLTFTASNATASQWRVMGDTSGSANSTVILAGETSSDGAVRTFAVNGLPNNVTAHFQVRVLYQGLWSPWADRSVAVAFTLPMAPVATLTAQDASGSMLVSITNPTPTGGAPTTTSNEVWVDDGLGAGLTRRVLGVAVNGSWTYWLPVGGRDYSQGGIVVRSLASTGAANSGIAT